MTGNAGISCGDEIRRGLSFTQEARLLAGVQLSIRSPAPWAVPDLTDRLARVASFGDLERERLKAELRRDLIEAPLRLEPHPEWRADGLTRLPSYLRDLQPGEGTAWCPQNHWLAPCQPVLSARLERLAEPEAGTLAMLPLEEQEGVTSQLAQAALAIVFQRLSSREQLAIRTALGEPRSFHLDSRVEAAVGEVLADRGEQVTRRLRAGLSFASSRAIETGHFFNRFRSFVLALCFSTDYSMEVRAVAYRWPKREGARLLRYWERESRTHDELVGSVRALMMVILLATLTIPGIAGRHPPGPESQATS